jgi:aldehyde dehydrogenase (NAD+)
MDLVKTMAEHDNLDALWYFGSDIAGSQLVENASTSNLKRTWVNNGLKRDWFNTGQAQGEDYLRHAVEIKNIWIPYGE